MAINRTKVLEFLTDYRNILKPNDYDDKFLIAICYVQLDDYPKAQELFEQSCKAMFTTQLWRSTSQPNWLVDICVLSGRKDLYPKVQQALESYKSDYRGGSLVALYSYALMELLLPAGNEIDPWIQGLLKKPKVKDTFAIGQVLQAIVEENQIGLDSALESLLKAHAGMAKYGGLRETAEGLLCMPAMSLAYVALQRGLTVNIENDYFSRGYVDYLIEHHKQARLISNSSAT